MFAFASTSDVRSGAEIGERILFIDGDVFVFDTVDEFEFIGLIGEDDSGVIF